MSKREFIVVVEMPDGISSVEMCALIKERLQVRRGRPRKFDRKMMPTNIFVRRRNGARPR